MCMMLHIFKAMCRASRSAYALRSEMVRYCPQSPVLPFLKCTRLRFVLCFHVAIQLGAHVLAEQQRPQMAPGVYVTPELGPVRRLNRCWLFGLFFILGIVIPLICKLNQSLLPARFTD